MKKRFLTLVVSIIAMLTCVFGLVACNKDGNLGNSSSGKGQVPIYQGMTISNGQSTVLTANSMSISLMSAKTPGNTDNNGNHNGWYKGDHNGKNEDIDQENPFPENGNNENIETETASTLDVIGAGQEIYYATANEEIYIHIHLSNPDNYEIMSFTLNGKKYSSYMFEEGSNMETLVLKYNVGSESGIQEYTIDAIKYIDGTDIKDVIMYGDKTVLAGVRIENQVNATISNATIQTNALSFNVKINDNDNLISYSQGCLKAVVYDGESVVAIKDLTVGDNNVSFDNLATSTLYQYAIVGYYDDLSGEGFAMNTLYKEAFYTKAIVLFDNVIVSQENIEFSFVWDSEFQDKKLTALKLYKGNTLTELSATATAVNNLLSNTIYTLIAEYKNGEKTENISLEFKTEAKAVPVVEIANPTKTQTSVGFAINETDADNVGAVTKIELIHANRTVVADSLDVREFTGLLSDHTYTVKVTYAYDLNDGVGSQEIVKTLDIKTEAKAVPVVEIANPTKTQTSVGFAINETDTDNVGAVTKIELIHANGTVVADSLDVREFTDLLSNNTYTVKATYEYDLNDGAGTQEVVKTLDIKTEAKAVPVVEIANPTKTQTSVSFAINETDTDNVGAVTKIELIHDADGIIVAEDVEVRSFEDVTTLHYNNCTLLISYEYDLNDGLGIQEIFLETYFEAGSQGLYYRQTKGGWEVSGLGSCQDVEVVIPSVHDGIPVISIAAYAFYENAILFSLVIPESVTSIGEYAFEDCGLTTLSIPDSVCYIGAGAFRGCDNLIHNSKGDLNYLGNENNPFLYLNEVINKNVSSVIIDDNCKFLGNVFQKCGNLKNIEIGKNVKCIDPWTFHNGSITNITVDINNDVYKDIDGNLYSKDGKTLIKYAAGKQAETFTIPDSVTSIGTCAFSECSLTSIVIGKNVKTIGTWAFSYCDKLSSIVMSSSVEEIQYNALMFSKVLKNIYIDDIVSWCNISGLQYLMDSGDKNLYLNNELLVDIVLPDNITSITKYAFYNCSSLRSITFSDTSSWYRTTDYENWKSKTNGTKTSVTTTSTNAAYFKSAYYNCYWYKL